MISDIVFHLIFLGLLFWAWRGREDRLWVILWGIVGELIASGLVVYLLGGGSLFVLIRLWCWAVFVHYPIVAATIFKGAPQAGQAFLVLSSVVVIGIGLDAFTVEPTQVEWTEEVISSPRLTKPLTVVVLSDIQTDKVGAYEEKILSRVPLYNPDLILLPGDYLQLYSDAEYQAELPHFTELVRNLSAPLGVFAVQGNMEWRKDWETLFAGTRVQAVKNTTVFNLGEVELTALSFDDSFELSPQVLSPRSSEKFRLVFGHGPNFALGRWQAELLVAGHTHGGQVRIPGFGPLLTFSSIPRDWAAGRTELPGRDAGTLWVSRGIGMERGQAPPLRFNCRPQVGILKLQPERP